MCPPNADQSGRTRQRWHLMSPRSRKICTLSITDEYSDASPQQFLFNDSYEWPWSVWYKLAKPGPMSRMQLIRPVIGKKSAKAVSALELLPAEILSLILEDESLDKSNVISLGLASKSLWFHVLSFVEKDCWLAAAPLAGVELALTGTHLKDLPAPFMKDDLAKSSVQIFPRGRMCEARKINWAAVNTYERLTKDPEEMWHAAFEAQDPLAAGIPRIVAKKLAEELSSVCLTQHGVSSDVPWVFRNLTTKQYVRCRPRQYDRDLFGYVDHPAAVNVRIEDVLLMRICWTTYKPWDTYDIDIYRGQWAGHCFDIVPMEQDGISAVGDGWEDCTEEVVGQAKTIANQIRCSEFEELEVNGEDDRMEARIRRILGDRVA